MKSRAAGTDDIPRSDMSEPGPVLRDLSLGGNISSINHVLVNLNDNTRLSSRGVKPNVFIALIYAFSFLSPELTVYFHTTAILGCVFCR